MSLGSTGRPGIHQAPPWFPEARTRLRYAPYDELFARLLSARDVPLRLPRETVPPWLRDDRAHRLALSASRAKARPVRLPGRLIPAR